MITYKNYRTGQVITESQYNKLSYLAKSGYSRIYNEQCNHTDDSDSNLLLGIGTGLILGSLFDDSNSDSSSFGSDSSDSSFNDFGGGDFGGGGAGGDW